MLMAGQIQGLGRLLKISIEECFHYSCDQNHYCNNAGPLVNIQFLLDQSRQQQQNTSLQKLNVE